MCFLGSLVNLTSMLILNILKYFRFHFSLKGYGIFTMGRFTTSGMPPQRIPLLMLELKIVVGGVTCSAQ